jgi:hypothetical protein
LPDPERFLVQRLGSGGLAHILVQRAQVIEALGSVGIFWPKNLPPDSERFLVGRFSFGVVPDPLEKESEVIQGIGRLAVLRTQGTL